MAFGLYRSRHADRNMNVRARARVLGVVFKFIMPFLVLGAAIFGFMQMRNLKPEPETKTEAPRAVPVLTVAAQKRAVELSVYSQGEVRPRSEINLAAQINGKITYMSPDFLAGGQFKKGDVLARIDSSDYDLRVIQSQANVASAQTALARELSEADIAKQDWDDLGQGTATPLSLREPQVAEARAKLAAANAVLQEAKLGQSRTLIYAPFNGRVRENSVSEGAYIAAGQNLGRIYAIDIADIKLALTDTALAKLGLGIGFKAVRSKPGPSVVLSANIAGKPHTWHGIIARTDSGYDSQARILYAYAQVNAPYGAGADNGVPLASGLFVNAAITGRTTVPSVIVPRNALRENSKVFIANDDATLSIKTVTIVSSDREQVVIASGLNGDEQVIISPVRGAAEGMKIEITPRADDET